MPALGLGTYQLKGRDGEDAILAALRLGYRHIDTAELYGNEEEVGRAIARSGVARRELFVTTKVWTDHMRARPFVRAAEYSLRRLGMDEADLVLIHWPNDAVPLDETIGALASLVEDGKTRFAGVSNFPPALLEQAIALSPVPLVCDQVPYALGQNQDALLGLCRRNNMALVAYTPLNRGNLTRHSGVAAVAKKHGRTPAQVALRWLVRQQGVAAIPKASSEARLKENLGIFDFDLDEEDFDTLKT